MHAVNFFKMKLWKYSVGFFQAVELNFFIIDARSHDQYAAGHLGGSYNLDSTLVFFSYYCVSIGGSIFFFWEFHTYGNVSIDSVVLH